MNAFHTRIGDAIITLGDIGAFIWIAAGVFGLVLFVYAWAGR